MQKPLYGQKRGQISPTIPIENRSNSIVKKVKKKIICKYRKKRCCSRVETSVALILCRGGKTRYSGNRRPGGVSVSVEGDLSI